MQQPALMGYEVVAVARSYANIRHLQLQVLPVEGSLLSHARRGQEETASRAALDVALRESGRIGETAVVEGVVGIQVQGLHMQHTIG